MLSGIRLTGKRVATHVALVHEPGHREPWLVALAAVPTVHRAFDHGPIRHPDRLARLLLVMALALHWAVSTGMWEAAHRPLPAGKKPRRTGRRSWPAAEPPSSRAAYAASNAAS